MPLQVLHLLQVFNGLNKKRRVQVIAGLDQAVQLPEAISSTELEAYLRLHKKNLSAWDIETLEEMDHAYLEESAKLRG